MRRQLLGQTSNLLIIIIIITNHTLNTLNRTTHFICFNVRGGNNSLAMRFLTADAFNAADMAGSSGTGLLGALLAACNATAETTSDDTESFASCASAASTRAAAARRSRLCAKAFSTSPARSSSPK